MKVALALNHRQHVEMFDSFAAMVRGLAQLQAHRNPAALEELDRRLDAGAVVRVSLSVGSAGPLGVLFQSVEPDGSARDEARKMSKAEEAQVNEVSPVEPAPLRAAIR